LQIKGFRLKTTTSGDGISVSSTGVLVVYDNLDFNVIVGSGINVGSAGSIAQAVTGGSVSITGGSTIHWKAAFGGEIQARGQTVTITGTPAFSYAFLSGSSLGLFNIDFETFSGSATGTRYVIDGNTVVYTGGAGVNYLPGNAAGSVFTGAQYT
jgi:hypothetical protein